MKLQAIVIALLLSAGAARADCDHFKWSLAKEKAWFAQPAPAPAEIAPGERAVEVALKAGDTSGFVVPLKKPMASGEYAAAVKIAAIPKAGVYQVTLSREAWVDVVQDQTRARTRNVSRQRDCPTFAKSVRFELAAGPALMQISGVATPTLALSLAPAP